MNKYNSAKSAQHGNMMMYAELTGNSKKYEIKSSYDNKFDVEYGTGIHAEGGNGRKDVPWAYKDEKTGELIWTKGQEPQPYMRPALYDNKQAILAILKEGITKK